jgi:serine/threonine protein kinase
MGRVYLARDTVLDRPVAVKFIGNVAPDADDRERFLVEARAVARLQHPNVVTIYRVGELEGHPYLITEYIRGKSLSELGLPVQWRKVLELGVGLARGLAAAHRHGVLHRDIKLANVVLSDTGEVKLLDFSLAKLLDPTAADRATKPPSADEAVRAATSAVERHNSRSPASRARRCAGSGRRRPRVESQRMVIPPMMSDSTLPMIAGSSSMIGMSLTQAGTLLGTPHYMAPELWRTEAATRRSDVYALGALMYILTTRAAADRRGVDDRAGDAGPGARAAAAARASAALRPRLAAIIDRCVRRDPFERYASGEDLLAALEALQPTGPRAGDPGGQPVPRPAGVRVEAPGAVLRAGRGDPGGARPPAGRRAGGRRRRLGRRQVVAVPRRRGAAGRGGPHRSGPPVGQRDDDARALPAADAGHHDGALFDMTRRR